MSIGPLEGQHHFWNTTGNQRASDVARQLVVTTKMLSPWRAQLEEHATPEQAFVGQGNDCEAEIKRLKRRIATLEIEWDVLRFNLKADSGSRRMSADIALL